MLISIQYMRPPLNFTGHGAMRTGQCKAGGGGQGPAKAGRPQGSGAQAWRRNTGKQHSQASYGSARCGDAVMQQILPTPFLGGPGFILGLPRYAPKSTIVFFHKMATMEAANPALRPLIPACPAPHCSQDQTPPPPPLSHLPQTLDLPRLLAELGVPVVGHASLPRAQALEATRKALRRAKVAFHPDKVKREGGALPHPPSPVCIAQGQGPDCASPPPFSCPCA